MPEPEAHGRAWSLAHGAGPGPASAQASWGTSTNAGQVGRRAAPKPRERAWAFKAKPRRGGLAWPSSVPATAAAALVPEGLDGDRAWKALSSQLLCWEELYKYLLDRPAGPRG